MTDISQRRGQSNAKGKDRNMNQLEKGNEKIKSEEICFWFEAFELKSGEALQREKREAAKPDGTYSSPPFSPCVPFCTAP